MHDSIAAQVLALCREELDALCGGAPQEGWLSYAYDYARRLLYPEKTGAEPYAAGAVFLLSVLGSVILMFLV